MILTRWRIQQGSVLPQPLPTHPPGSRPFVKPALRVRRESVAVTARGGGTSYPIASTERTAAPNSGIVMSRISITVTNPLIEATTR